MANKRLIDAYDLTIHLAKKNAKHPLQYDDVLAVIADEKRIEATEVVHAHWYKAPHHPYRCSNCGEMALLDMYGESHYRSNYCPNRRKENDCENIYRT